MKSIPQSVSQSLILQLSSQERRPRPDFGGTCVSYHSETNNLIPFPMYNSPRMHPYVRLYEKRGKDRHQPLLVQVRTVRLFPATQVADFIDDIGKLRC